METLKIRGQGLADSKYRIGATRMEHSGNAGILQGAMQIYIWSNNQTLPGQSKWGHDNIPLEACKYLRPLTAVNSVRSVRPPLTAVNSIYRPLIWYLGR